MVLNYTLILIILHNTHRFHVATVVSNGVFIHFHGTARYEAHTPNGFHRDQTTDRSPSTAERDPAGSFERFVNNIAQQHKETLGLQTYLHEQLLSTYFNSSYHLEEELR